MKFKSKNILITGGAGFIGSNFIKTLFDENPTINIYNLDKLTYAGDLKNTVSFSNHPNYKFIKGDICDSELLAKLFNIYEIDGVINFAAESHVDNSIKNPYLFVKTNFEGVQKLLSICYKSWMKSPFHVKDEFKNARFHQVSTDEVYGSILSESFDENSNYNPSSPYSASKAAADLLVKAYHKTYGLNITISISSNNYGPNQHKEKFIPKLIECIKKDEYFPLYGNGKHIRNWIHVNDNCSAIKLIFNMGINGESYNIGSDFEISNIELIEKISQLSDKKAKIKFVNDRFGHDFRYSIKSNKLHEETGWKPVNNLIDLIKDLKF